MSCYFQQYPDRRWPKTSSPGSVSTVLPRVRSIIEPLISYCSICYYAALSVNNRSIIEPLISYCSICCYPAVFVSNCNRLLKISHVSIKIISFPTPVLSEMIDPAILRKTHAVAADSDHPPHPGFPVLQIKSNQILFRNNNITFLIIIIMYFWYSAPSK